MKDYYDYIHYDSSIRTISQFSNDINSPIKSLKNSLGKFLSFKDENGVRNLDRIWENYSLQQREDEDNKSRYLSSQNTVVDFDWEINIGTILHIPKEIANLEVISVMGKDVFLKQQSFKTYIWDQFYAISTDPDYYPMNRVGLNGSSDYISYLQSSASCWIYLKAIDFIVDLTPFIRDIDFVTGKDGGNFTVSLNDIKDLGEVYKNELGYFSYFNKVTNGKLHISFFQKMIQQNDIVFIRFEKLLLEKNERSSDLFNLFIDKSELPGKVYDCIGLVDLNSESYSPSANVSNINFSGRDLTKLLIEEGAYFFPISLQNNSKDFFISYNENDSVFKRIFDTGNFQNIFTETYRSIRQSLGFIFNQLTNIGMIPPENKLFSFYESSLNPATGGREDRTSKTYITNQDNLDSVEQNGLWKIVKLLVDNQIDDRRLVNGELSNPSGDILSLANKICQSPFVEFYGDTYLDQFAFIARQPPFTKSQVQDYIKSERDGVKLMIEIDGSGSDTNFSWDERYYTWYQLEPMEGLYGSDQFTSGTFMPIVYFEEFAQYFGMQGYVQVDNYITNNIFNGDQSKTNIDLYRESLTNDLLFLIQSNVILPFTRKGTIHIEGGDRRIKKFTWIYFKPTNEIFYVTTVTNSISVNKGGITRKTVLTVERGMVLDYVEKDNYVEINGKSVLVNYFNIVNVDIIKKVLRVNLGGEIREYTSTSNIQLINKEVFDFFIQRKQFD